MWTARTSKGIVHQGARQLYLSDRGIREALKQGILKFTPELEDSQIQPISVDLRVHGTEDVGHLEDFRFSEWERFYDDLLIPPFSNVTLSASQGIEWMRPLMFQAELRSSLRRLGCYTPNGRAAPCFGGRTEVEFNNFGPFEILLREGDKFAQLLFSFYEREHSENSPGVYSFHGDQDQYDKLAALDHGHFVVDSIEARLLHADGYFSVGKQTTFDGPCVVVHAGRTARLMRKRKEIDFAGKTDFSDIKEKVDLPYLLLPGEHIVVDVEDLELSPYVGIHFNEMLFEFGRSPRRDSDSVLWSHFDGLVDPGYKGAFSRQPKTFYNQGIMIEPGMVLGHGKIIYFPNSVERPYGSKGLESHYQNADGMKFLQNGK